MPCSLACDNHYLPHFVLSARVRIILRDSPSLRFVATLTRKGSSLSFCIASGRAVKSIGHSLGCSRAQAYGTRRLPVMDGPVRCGQRGTARTARCGRSQVRSRRHLLLSCRCRHMPTLIAASAEAAVGARTTESLQCLRTAPPCQRIHLVWFPHMWFPHRRYLAGRLQQQKYSASAEPSGGVDVGAACLAMPPRQQPLLRIPCIGAAAGGDTGLQRLPAEDAEPHIGQADGRRQRRRLQRDQPVRCSIVGLASQLDRCSGF